MFFVKEAAVCHARGAMTARRVFVDEIRSMAGARGDVAVLDDSGKAWSLERDGAVQAHAVVGNRSADDGARPAVVHVLEAAWEGPEDLLVKELRSRRRRLPRLARALGRPQVVVVGPVSWPPDFLEQRPGLVKVLRKIPRLHVLVRDQDSGFAAHAELARYAMASTPVVLAPSPAFVGRWELVHEEDFVRGSRNVVVSTYQTPIVETGMTGWELVPGWESDGSARNAFDNAMQNLAGVESVATDLWEVHLACMVLDVPHYWYAWGTERGHLAEWFPSGSLCQLRSGLDGSETAG